MYDEPKQTYYYYYIEQYSHKMSWFNMTWFKMSWFKMSWFKMPWFKNVLIRNVRDLLHDMERSYEFMNTNIQKKIQVPDISNQDILNQDILNQDILNQDMLNQDILNQVMLNHDVLWLYPIITVQYMFVIIPEDGHECRLLNKKIRTQSHGAEL
jgi:hypothetical protein